MAEARKTRASRWLWGAAILLAVLGVLTLRVVWSGEAELVESDAALKRGDAHEATVRARRAAGWYAPGAPHVRIAYARLIALARAAEEHKRIDIALFAWRSVHSAAHETRWLVVPHKSDLELADREIARLVALDAAPDERVSIEQATLSQLTRPSGPELAWLVALVAAFALTAGGFGWWARAAASPGGALSWRRARLPLAITIAGVALWLISVWRA
jgi:hypothetical protein